MGAQVGVPVYIALGILFALLVLFAVEGGQSNVSEDVTTGGARPDAGSPEFVTLCELGLGRDFFPAVLRKNAPDATCGV